MKKIFNKIKQIINDFLGSLDNVPGKGFSGRKLTALFAILMGMYITTYLLPLADQLHALFAWQLLALLCLGIVTVEQVIKFKNGSNGNASSDTAEK